MNNIPVAHDSFLEARELCAVRPDVLTGHSTIDIFGTTRGIFPSDVKSFMKVSAVLRVSILPEQPGVAPEVRALMDVNGFLVRLWQFEELFSCSESVGDDALRDAMILDCCYVNDNSASWYGSWLTIEEADVDTRIANFVCQGFSSIDIVAVYMLQISTSGYKYKSLYDEIID